VLYGSGVVGGFEFWWCLFCLGKRVNQKGGIGDGVMAFNWSSHGGDVGFYWLLHLKEKKRFYMHFSVHFFSIFCPSPVTQTQYMVAKSYVRSRALELDRYRIRAIGLPLYAA